MTQLKLFPLFLFVPHLTYIKTFTGVLSMKLIYSNSYKIDLSSYYYYYQSKLCCLCNWHHNCLSIGYISVEVLLIFRVKRNLSKDYVQLLVSEYRAFDQVGCRIIEDTCAKSVQNANKKYRVFCVYFGNVYIVLRLSHAPVFMRMTLKWTLNGTL